MKTYHMTVNSVLRTINIIEKSTGEVVEILKNQSEKAIRALKGNLGEEYPNCYLELEEITGNERVLARCRDLGNDSPSMAVNYKQFGTAVKQHTTFLLDADAILEAATDGKNGEYKEAVPVTYVDNEPSPWVNCKIHAVEGNIQPDNTFRMGKKTRFAKLG